MTFRFADPYWLALLPALVALLLLSRRMAEGRPGIVFSSVGLLSGLPRGRRLRFRPLLTALQVAVVVLVILALARPQQGEATGTLPADGIDIILILDASSSMTEPAEGNRTKVEVAREVIKEFIGGREHDRMGLVIFREEAFLASPLTLDYDALQRLVDDTETSFLPDGTAIGLAAMEGLNVLRQSEAASRIMILLTDGQNNQHLVEPEEAAEVAATLNVRIYTVGLATARSPGEQGVRSGIDEETLRHMAEVTDGRYYRATDAETLQNIYREIGELETSRVERQRFIQYRELAPLLLVPAVGLAVLQVALAGTVLRRLP